jgi:ATP-dependent DNA ligase
VTPKPPTYPARPLNGGKLELARPKRGEWYAEPKFNGWRTLVHRHTGAMFNRQLEPLSIQAEFAQALAAVG